MATRIRNLVISAFSTITFIGTTTTVNAQSECSDDCYCTSSCESDNDCQEGMVCATETEQDCPSNLDTGCMEGESDDECGTRVKELRASECTLVETRQCDFYWSTECEDDADCGDEQLACTAGQGCQPASDRCATDEDCAAMWSCTEVEGFCTEDTEEHGECVDGRFAYSACTPPPYCGTADSTNEDPSEEDDSDDVLSGSNDAYDGEPSKTSNGCSFAAGAPRGPAGVLGLALLALVATARRRRSTSSGREEQS